MSTPELRKMWRDHFDECDRIRAEYDKWYSAVCQQITDELRKNRYHSGKFRLPEYPKYWPPTPTFPEVLRDMT